MSENCDNTKHPLLRDGTSQPQRLLKALLPSYVSVDERSMEDLIEFAKKYAEEIRYYNALNTIDGNWVDFFIKAIDEKGSSTDPHYALFIAFLDLFKLAQDDLNTITQRHLDFYYREVLQLKERPAVPDQVFIIFELARQVTSHLLKKGILLDGGKDATAQDLLYALDKDIVVNKAQVTELKALFADRNGNYRLYASPVANSADGLGKKIEDEEPKWRTFGRPGNPVDRMQAEAGFAFASPILLMNEGNRAVSIKLNFNNPVNLSASQLKDAFRLQFSGAEEWIEVLADGSKSPSDDTLVTGNSIIINRTITQAQPAIVPYDVNVLLQPFNTTWPVVKILLNTADNSNPYAYKLLRNLVLVSADITVNVTGVRTLALAGDQGELSPAKPFTPFTSRPLLGSRFYIGSQEVFSKKLSSLDIDITWHGIPEGSGGFASYYHGYIPTGENSKRKTSGFKSAVSILDGKKWIPINTYQLFEDKPLLTAAAAKDTSFVSGPIILMAVISSTLFSPGVSAFRRISITDAALKKVGRDPLLGEVTDVETNTFKGFIRLELTNVDFGHKNYQQTLTEYVLKASKLSKTDPIPPQPNEPYTPTVKEISLNYSSTVSITFKQNNSSDFSGRIDQFFHVHPFGVAEIHPFLFLTPSPLSLLPQFNDEGTLYIGVSGLVPSQVLSLLFKVSEGSANPDFEKQPVHWSYLVNDQWVEFPALKVLTEATNGLLTSGIVAFDVPSQATSTNTVLTPGLHWFRVSVTDFSGAVCDLIDVRAQADTATFIDNGNDPDHLRKALPAQTISRLRDSDAAISTVLQPYASFGGKVKEQSNDFYVRVSERLRHKHRAITIWDYERLVLEKFPAIYKVKCISHTENNRLNYSELEPGHVTLITISNLRNKNAVNPLEPKTSLVLQTQIHDYITALTSTWVELDVRNPLFEQIRVILNVKFLPGFDNGFYGTQLNEDIKKFLCPWAFESTSDIVFGGKIHRSMILDFIEEREYVDFVACFKMDHIVNGEVFGDIEEVVATTAASVLVSAPQHEITVLETDDCECSENEVKALIEPADDSTCDVPPPPKPRRGIGVSVINSDFIVGQSNETGINFFIIENDFRVD